MHLDKMEKFIFNLRFVKLLKSLLTLLLLHQLPQLFMKNESLFFELLFFTLTDWRALNELDSGIDACNMSESGVQTSRIIVFLCKFDNPVAIDESQ